MSIPEPLWQLLATLFATSLRPLSPRARYRAVIRISRLVHAVLGPALMRRPARYAWSTLLDETIRALLRSLARRPMRFDPDYRVDAPPDFVSTIREQGVIIVTAHFPLNSLSTRYLHDHGANPVVVRAVPSGAQFIWGTGVALNQILPLPNVLLTIRRFLAERRSVMMAIDRALPIGRTVPIDTPSGRLHISTSIFEFSKRCNVPILFTCVRTDAAGEVFVFLRRIEPTVEAFLDTLREQTQQMDTVVSPA